LGSTGRGARWSARFEKDGPAAKAGLQPGDVILGVNSKPIERYGELSGSIAAMKRARMHHWMSGAAVKKLTVSVKVTELKNSSPRRKPAPSRRSARPTRPVSLD